MSTYRYHRVPTFGRGTIRLFHKNASAMKKLAACDYEDLLQVYFLNVITVNQITHTNSFLVFSASFRTTSSQAT
jgi:hypothetical protein